MTGWLACRLHINLQGFVDCCSSSKDLLALAEPSSSVHATMMLVRHLVTLSCI